MNPEMLEFIKSLLQAVIPVVALYFFGKYLRITEDRELAKQAIRLAGGIAKKFLNEGLDLATIIELVTEELLLVLEKLDEGEASAIATSAVLEMVGDNDLRLVSYRQAVLEDSKEEIMFKSDF